MRCGSPDRQQAILKPVPITILNVVNIWLGKYIQKYYTPSI